MCKDARTGEACSKRRNLQPLDLGGLSLDTGVDAKNQAVDLTPEFAEETSGQAIDLTPVDKSNNENNNAANTIEKVPGQAVDLTKPAGEKSKPKFQNKFSFSDFSFPLGQILYEINDVDPFLLKINR